MKRMMLSGGMKLWSRAMIALVATAVALGCAMTVPQRAMAQTRVVVLPFYTEEGANASEGGAAVEHYRRVMRFINNQLNRNDFEVINPFAKENIEKEYDRVMERARQDSVLAGREVCEKYGVDIAYIVWLKAKVEYTPDGYYKSSVQLDGEGYDSAGHDLGAGIFQTFKVTRRDRDEAIGETERWAGDLVGRKLTSWHEERPATAVLPAGEQLQGKGILARSAQKYEKNLNVRLVGATDYEVAEVFGKVLNTVTGVVEAKRFGSSIIPNNPQASYVSWRAKIEDTEPFRLEANIMKMIKDVIAAGGTIDLKGVPYRYTPDEIVFLKGVRPGKSNAQQLQFVVDRGRVVGRELAVSPSAKEKGFE